MRVPVRMYKMSGGGQYNVPEEGDVVAWFKQIGDHVDKGEELCEIETDKATESMLAPVSGILVDIAYPVDPKNPWIRGEIVFPLSDPICYDPPFCWIETEEAVIVPVLLEPHVDEASVAPALPDSRPDNDPARRKRISPSRITTYREPENAKPRMTIGALLLVQEEKISNEELFNFFQGTIPLYTEYHIKRLLEKRDADIHLQRDVVVRSNLTQEEIKEVTSVPLARTIAHEKGIDLADVSGTGPEGLILASDVERKVGAQEVRVTQEVAEPSEEPILLSMPRLWRTIAANMEAASRMPTADIRVDGRRFNIRRLTEFYRANHQSYKLGLWFPLMVAYARVLSKEQFILFNSYWHEEVDSAGKVTPYIAAHRYVHMGIAYDRGQPSVIDWDSKTIQGERLRILTVRNVHRISLAEIIGEVSRLFESAIKKKFSLQDTSGYTAIFNNIGVLGHHSGRAILTQGIASELNMGSVDLDSGEAVIQLVLDHRLIDGAMTTPFFRALYKELTQCVLPELEALL